MTSLPDGAQLTPARRRLFLAALRLFAERGYAAVSVRDIADELGQQPGAIYNHVTSKQHLLGELVGLGVTEHRDRLRAAVDSAGDEPVEQVRALVRAHVRVHLDHPDLARLISRETRALDETQHAAAAAVIAETQKILTDVIERGRLTGVFGEVDVLLAVQAIGAMGVRLPEWWTPAARAAEEIADVYAGFALKLLR